MSKKRVRCEDCVFTYARKIVDNIYRCDKCLNVFIHGKGKFQPYHIKRVNIIIKTFKVDINLRMYIFDILKIMSLIKRQNNANYYYYLLQDFLGEYERETGIVIDYDKRLPKLSMKRLLS